VSPFCYIVYWYRLWTFSITDYSCALQKEILVQGRMYITQNWVCFYANIFTWETLVSYYAIKICRSRSFFYGGFDFISSIYSRTFLSKTLWFPVKIFWLSEASGCWNSLDLNNFCCNNQTVYHFSLSRNF
jgi:hypothetical protein